MGGLQRVGGRQGCGCKRCADASGLETIGVHERRFGAGEGSFGGGNPHTLYLSIVREPKSWLKSVVAHTCREDPNLAECRTGRIDDWFDGGAYHEHSAAHRTFGSVNWYHTPDLQSHLLDGIFASQNWVVCTLERRDTILGVLEAASGLPLSRKAVDAHPNKLAPANLTADLDAGRYAHLYHADAALYAHISRSGGCIHRLGDEWQRKLHLLLDRYG